MTTLIADIEGDGLLPELTTIWQVSIIDHETGELASYHHDTIRAGLDRLASADRVVMHNGLGYDLKAIAKVTGVEIDWRRVIDTLTLSRLGNPNRNGGHSLARWGEVLGFPKIEHEDWTQWSPEMEQRCNTDTELTQKVFETLEPMLELMPVAVEIEHHCHWAVTECIERGFTLDEQEAIALLEVLMREKEEIEDNIRQTFEPVLVPKNRNNPTACLKVVNKTHALHGALEPGVEYSPLVVEEFNPGSRQQIARRLKQKYGWKPTKFTKGGQPEVSEDTLGDLEYPEAKVLTQYLKADKLVGQINSEIQSNGKGGGWLHHLQDDGRVHAGLQPLTAITGRLSCSGPNLQQVATDERMRSCWLPKKGWKLVGVDAEGLELRCLAHYLAKWDGGEYARILLEADIHSHVRDMLGLNLRSRTKNVEYGWLYGAGNPKIGLLVQRDAFEAGKEISYEKLGLKKGASLAAIGGAVKRRLITGLNGLEQLQETILRDYKLHGKIKGLDGRSLWIRSEHSALNFLLQSAGIIVCKKAWMLIDEEIEKLGVSKDDYGLVMQVHDEFQYEAKPEVAELVAEGGKAAIVRAGVELGFRCPLSGSSKIGDNWSQTH